MVHGRGFVLQTIVVMPVVLTLAYGSAVLLDGLLGRVIEVGRRVRAPGRRALVNAMPRSRVTAVLVVLMVLVLVMWLLTR